LPRIASLIRPGTQVGDYVLEALVGEGGMGVVYSAHHHIIKSRVAIKLLQADKVYRKDNVARFYREARVLAQLRHPNIVQLFAFDVHVGTYPYFVMELLEGRTLAAHLESAGTLRPLHAIRILVEVAKALDWAHRQGVIHRDLKPSNVFLIWSELEPEPARLKLLDFGLAKLLDDSTLGSSPELDYHTRTGVVMGTPEYMAPEQMVGLPVGPATDIYALATIAHELLTGARHAADAADMAGVPDPAREALARGLSHEMEDRPPTALALVSAIAGGYAAEDHGRDIGALADELARLEETVVDAPPLGEECGPEAPGPRARARLVAVTTTRPPAAPQRRDPAVPEVRQTTGEQSCETSTVRERQPRQAAEGHASGRDGGITVLGVGDQRPAMKAGQAPSIGEESTEREPAEPDARPLVPSITEESTVRAPSVGRPVAAGAQPRVINEASTVLEPTDKPSIEEASTVRASSSDRTPVAAGAQPRDIIDEASTVLERTDRRTRIRARGQERADPVRRPGRQSHLLWIALAVAATGGIGGGIVLSGLRGRGVAPFDEPARAPSSRVQMPSARDALAPSRDHVVAVRAARPDAGATDGPLVTVARPGEPRGVEGVGEGVSPEGANGRLVRPGTKPREGANGRLVRPGEHKTEPLAGAYAPPSHGGRRCTGAPFVSSSSDCPCCSCPPRSPRDPMPYRR
jgi:serine/threonine-protein kinase